MKRKLLILFLTVIAQIVLTVCSDRVETPTKGNDSTIVYPSKSANGIEAQILFCEKVNKKTGGPIRTGEVFSVREKEKVYAIIELNNRVFHRDKDLMFHVDWLDSSGNSLFKKRIDLLSNDSSFVITSSINISPDKREPGNYSLRVYLFRELIAEKKFQLVNSITDSATVKKKDAPKKKIKSEKKSEDHKSVKPKVKAEIIKADIILCKKVSKKTGKPIGADTIFTIKDRANVKAIVSFEKQEIKTNEQMKFYFNWIGPDGKLFYKKRVVYTTSNPSFSISNSVSITPEKRQPGIYTLQIVYRKKIIAEQKFELITETK